MNKIDEPNKSSLNGRCHRCEFAKCITANGHFKFLGCTHPPYKGKWVIEIKDCPKTQRKDGENHEQDT